MTSGCDRRETFQVHSATESRLKYKYGEVLRLKNDSNFRSLVLQKAQTRHTGLCGYKMTEDTIKTHTSA